MGWDDQIRSTIPISLNARSLARSLKYTTASKARDTDHEGTIDELLYSIVYINNILDIYSIYMQTFVSFFRSR